MHEPAKIGITSNTDMEICEIPTNIGILIPTDITNLQNKTIIRLFELKTPAENNMCMSRISRVHQNYIILTSNETSGNVHNNSILCWHPLSSLRKATHFYVIRIFCKYFTVRLIEYSKMGLPWV